MYSIGFPTFFRAAVAMILSSWSSVIIFRHLLTMAQAVGLLIPRWIRNPTPPPGFSEVKVSEAVLIGTAN
jgi:hypothetical protein